MANTKIQRWAVLIAEFGAPIHYHSGKNNVHADMLSRLKAQNVSAIDTICLVEPQSNTVTWSLPLHFDKIELTELSNQQQLEFADRWSQAIDPDNDDFEIQEEVLFSCRRPGPKQACYPRILLSTKWRHDIIDRCHKQVAHAGDWKTLRAIQSYVWTGMRKEIKEQCLKCPICHIHKSHPERVALGRMRDPCYPHQIVGMDLVGPLTRSARGHVYLLTFIDHLTGWAEAYSIGNKSGDTVADILHDDYFPMII